MIDWDRWRANYDDMSWRDQLDFYSMVERLHPDQRFYSAESVKAFLLKSGPLNTRCVLEIGGWKGELAAEVGPTKRWLNVEIFPEALRYGPHESWYQAMVPHDFIWKVGLPRGYDALIMSHTIEHIRWREFAAIIDQFDGEWVFLEAPLHRGGRDWSGYGGTHIFEAGWVEVDELMGRHGFRPIHGAKGADWTEGQIVWYRREGLDG